MRGRRKEQDLDLTSHLQGVATVRVTGAAAPEENNLFKARLIEIRVCKLYVWQIIIII